MPTTIPSTITISKKTPVQGTVNFIQHNLPGLEAGEYLLNVSQTVSTQKDPFGNHYFFAVQGERFTLNPKDVYATFPPDQANGEFNNTLPHIVLTNQTFPWMRYPTLDEPERQFKNNKEHEPDIPTWLAVLLFDEDDVSHHPTFKPQPQDAKVRDLFIKQKENDPHQGYSIFYKVADLDASSETSKFASHLDYGESPDAACQVLDIPMKLFWEVAPSVDDLKMMAHLRNVEITKKATQNGVPASRNDLSKVPGTSTFAVVLGNRLPQAGKRTFAHLVVLEGLAPFLPLDPATSDTTDKITAPTTVTWTDSGNKHSFAIQPDGLMRLICLKSWSFTSTGDSSHFENLLLGLQPKHFPDPNKSIADPSTDFSLGLPVPAPKDTDSDAAKRAKNALSMGYTALEHHTRGSSQTVSWYRGPLLPYQVLAKTVPPTLSSADAANAYNPDTGMLDISYGAAWQLGRLLALQDKHFSVILYNWRRRNLRLSVAAMEALVAQQTLDDIQQQLNTHDLIYPLLQMFLPEQDDQLRANTANTSVIDSNARPNLTQGRQNRADSHKAVLADPQKISVLLKNQLNIPVEIYSWLGKLKLLDGVPFNYLVPDEKMLPAETIRFFYLDMNWVHVLLDGALSIGRNASPVLTSPEHSHDVAVKPDVALTTNSHARIIRSTALGMPPQAKNTGPLEVISGFLLRSDVVKGWPGLEVNAYAKDGSLMDIVRFERLAPTVLLCLLEKDGMQVGFIDIHEPAEGLHFGVTNKTPQSINLRYNYEKDEKHKPGAQVENIFQPAPFRSDSNSRLLRLFRLSKDLLDPKYKDYIQGIYSEFDHLPSSEFAMQMLKGVGLVSFNLQEPNAS